VVRPQAWVGCYKVVEKGRLSLGCTRWLDNRPRLNKFTALSFEASIGYTFDSLSIQYSRPQNHYIHPFPLDNVCSFWYTGGFVWQTATMYLSAFPHLLRAPGEDSGPCSSLIIQPSYRTRHIANSFKIPGSRSLTPSTCNANSGGQDTGQCLVLYPDPFFTAQCQFTVDGHGMFHLTIWPVERCLTAIAS